MHHRTNTNTKMTTGSTSIRERFAQCNFTNSVCGTTDWAMCRLSSLSPGMLFKRCCCRGMVREHLKQLNQCDAFGEVDSRTAGVSHDFRRRTDESHIRIRRVVECIMMYLACEKYF